MPEPNTILVVTDPTVEEQPAVQRAAHLARESDGRLELFACVYNEYLSDTRMIDSSSLKHARAELVAQHVEQLEAMAGPFRDKGTIVTTSGVWDHPLHEGIVRHAMQIDADIVFKDTHHHSAISRALFSNTDWNLIRTCPKPLWLVKPQDIADESPIVAAIDPMNEHDKPAALDDQIMHFAKNVSSVLGGKTLIFHAYDPRAAVVAATSNAYVPLSLPVEEIKEQMQERHSSRVAEISSYYDVSDSDTYVVCGMAHEELPKFAREHGAKVVVMGAVARNRLKRLFIGATAERTLEHLPCDLVVIKPDWFKSPVAAA